MAVRVLHFDIAFDGHGVVNFDDWETQKFEQRRLGLSSSMHNNVKPAKIVVNQKANADGHLEPIPGSIRVRVANGALRNAIFEDSSIPQTIAAFLAPEDQAHVSGGFEKIVRGGTMLSKGGPLKRKSPLLITSAIQTGGTTLMREVVTQTAARTATSLSYKDTVGDIEYESKGCRFDFGEMAFLSCCPIFDRAYFSEDYTQNLKEGIEEATGIKVESEVGYYTKSQTRIEVGERGLLLSEAHLLELTKRTFDGIVDLYIVRPSSGAYLKCKHITAFLGDRTITIKSHADVESLIAALKEEGLAIPYRPASTEAIENARSVTEGLSGDKTARAAKKEADKLAKEQRKRAKSENEAGA